MESPEPPIKVIRISVKKRLALRRLTKSLAASMGFDSSVDLVAALVAAEPVPIANRIVLFGPERK